MVWGCGKQLGSFDTSLAVVFPLRWVIGQRVSFWRDKWCEDKPLCDSFPSLFALAVSKETWVKDVWNVSKGGGSWSPRFTRPFND